MKQMDRTLTLKVFIIWLLYNITHKDNIQYRINLVHATNEICFKTSASAYHNISSRTVMFFSVVMNWTSVLVLV